jgi:predicted transcriptional regulator
MYGGMNSLSNAFGVLVRMIDLRKIVLKQLEQGSVDVLTLRKKLIVDFIELVNELDLLLEAGYVTKTDDSFYLTERGRQYLEVEKKSGS